MDNPRLGGFDADQLRIENRGRQSLFPRGGVERDLLMDDPASLWLSANAQSGLPDRVEAINSQADRRRWPVQGR